MKRIKFVIPKNKNDYEYIGFNAAENNSIFIFPCQYVDLKGIGSCTICEKDDKLLYNNLKYEAKKILDLIARYKYKLKTGNDNGDNFLYSSIIWLIKDFLNNGYYKERRVEIKPVNSGKICWKRTMKTDNILIDDDHLIFKKIFRFKKKIENEQIITEIYKCCLFFAVENLGWVYDLYTVDKSIFDIENSSQRQFMIMFLKQNLTDSFIDYKKQLLTHLLKILQGINDNLGTEILNATDSEFEYVFERLVQNVFGTEDVKNFYPRATYHFSNSTAEASKLRPDSIMWLKASTTFEKTKTFCEKRNINLETQFKNLNCDLPFDDFVIIDAKYYGYGYQAKNETGTAMLPQSSDVTKQLAYAKYITENRIMNGGQTAQIEKPRSLIVSSVFVLPFSNLNYNQYFKSKQNSALEKVGFAVVGDANAERAIVSRAATNLNVLMDERVYVCLVDLKTLIDADYRNEDTEKQKLKTQLLNCIKQLSIR